MTTRRESLALCSACSWAGVYAVAPAVGALAALPPAKVNPCPRCQHGDVRCAITVAQEDEAIRQHLAAVLPGVRVLPTSDGKLAIVATGPGAHPRVLTLDRTELGRSVRAELDDLVARLRPPAPSGLPYR